MLQYKISRTEISRTEVNNADTNSALIATELRSVGRHRRVSRPALLCVCLAISVCACAFGGCAQAPDILSQNPVIPLTDTPHELDDQKEDPGAGHEGEEYPELHVSGDVNGTVKADASGDVASTEDARDDVAAEDAAGEASAGGGHDMDTGDPVSGQNRENSKDRKDGGNDYQVEGVQLSEEQLKKMSAYFNLKDVNPYLQQVYLIPEDFDPDAENDPVNITCVAGSYDSNRLYSIFYKKEDSDALWNVIMRREDDTSEEDVTILKWGLTPLRFHSNQLLDPNREKSKKQSE